MAPKPRLAAERIVFDPPPQGEVYRNGTLPGWTNLGRRGIAVTLNVWSAAELQEV
jgi:hypothetical protein